MFTRTCTHLQVNRHQLKYIFKMAGCIVSKEIKIYYTNKQRLYPQSWILILYTKTTINKSHYMQIVLLTTIQYTVACAVFALISSRLRCLRVASTGPLDNKCYPEERSKCGACAMSILWCPKVVTNILNKEQRKYMCSV